MFDHYTINTSHCIEQSEKIDLESIMPLYQEAKEKGQVKMDFEEGEVTITLKINENSGIARMLFENKTVTESAFSEKGIVEDVKQLFKKAGIEKLPDLTRKVCVDYIPMETAAEIPFSIHAMAGDFARCFAACYFIEKCSD